MAPKPSLDRYNRRRDRERRGLRQIARGVHGTGIYAAYVRPGRKTLAKFLEPLTYLFEFTVVSPPKGLDTSLLSYEQMALCALLPLLSCINRPYERHKRLSRQQIEMRMGRRLRDTLTVERLLASKDKRERRNGRAIRKRYKRARKYLKSDWSEKAIQRVGFWLYETALKLEYFTHDEDFYLIVHPEWQAYVDAIAPKIRELDNSSRPFLAEPPPWRGWKMECPDGQKATFIRSWRPGVKDSIEAAFEDPRFKHHAGVNAMRRVPLVVDWSTRELVRKYAVQILNRKVDKKPHDESDWQWEQKQRQRKENQRLVNADLVDADWIGDRAFWPGYNCDRRGRVYPLSHFGYGREDHVRAMFRFRDGQPLGPDGERWLQIHLANCAGFDGVDKGSREDRINWVNENREWIQTIAVDPDGTFGHWSEAENPFAYVAACRELSAAWATGPEEYVSNLPVALDCTASGLQHLAALSRDAEAGRLVNLTDDPRRYDIYSEVAERVERLIKAADHDLAKWRREQFRHLGHKVRKLVKQPVMTLYYGVTDGGMTLQIAKAYNDLGGGEYPEGAFGYLREKVREACNQLLRGPTEVMKYITDLAAHRRAAGGFLEWTNSLELPVVNRYYIPSVKTLYLTGDGHRVTDRRKAEREVADGETDEIDERAITSAAANFIHSLDAALLSRTAFVAARNGIDMLPVHDCFSCPAGKAERLNEIIRNEMVRIYVKGDPLTELRLRNDPEGKVPAPKRGDLDLFQILKNKYCVT